LLGFDLAPSRFCAQAHTEPAQQESAEVSQAVPADLQRPEAKGDGVDVGIVKQGTSPILEARGIDQHAQV
jgi:hypothetical protein